MYLHIHVIQDKAILTNTNKPLLNYPKITAYHKNKNQGKKCFVCRKIGCWSIKYTEDEREYAIQKFRRNLGSHLR